MSNILNTLETPLSDLNLIPYMDLVERATGVSVEKLSISFNSTI